MRRTLILAAAAAVAIFAFSAPGPAQARMANPGLSAAVPAATVDVQYYSHRRHRGYRAYRGGYRSYGYRPYRSYGYAPRCYTQRIVRWDGRVRFVRRCR